MKLNKITLNRIEFDKDGRAGLVIPEQKCEIDAVIIYSRENNSPTMKIKITSPIWTTNGVRIINWLRNASFTTVIINSIIPNKTIPAWLLLFFTAITIEYIIQRHTVNKIITIYNKKRV